MITPIKLLVESLGFRLRAPLVRVIFVYVRFLYSLVRHQGRKGACMHLKALQIGLMQAISGYTPKAKATPVRYSRAGDGLPRVIPLPHRKRIRGGDTNLIRL